MSVPTSNFDTLTKASLRRPIVMPTRRVVFVVDDDISMREALTSMISAAGWDAVAFGSAEAFLAYPPSSGPSCLILDVNLPDLNGLDLQARIARDRAEMPIIFMTGYGDVPMTVRAMKAGAMEFLTKPFDDTAILEAVASALDRSRKAIDQQRALRSLHEHHESLSRRERQVMAMVVTGLLNKQIAGQLGISEITVKAHRGRVMQKMQVRSLAELVTISAGIDLSQTNAM
jgi:FixJ family two-component response regulator